MLEVGESVLYILDSMIEREELEEMFDGTESKPQ